MSQVVGERGSTPEVASSAEAARPTFVSVNPADPAEVVGSFGASTVVDVRDAIASAQSAQGAWAALPPGRRATLLGEIGSALTRHADELAALVTREEGKSLGESRGEIQKAAEQFHFASQLAYQVEGTTFPDEEPSTFSYTVRSPLGVVVVITPWNFPVSLPARKIAPALAAGNTVVFKPSPATAAVGELLVGICRAAGLPEGVLQLVQGSEPAAMDALVTDARVAAVTFTGSDAVGAALEEKTRPGVRLQLELGGHNLVVVCGDADLRAAAESVVRGGVGLTGQACTATDVVLVEAAAYREFLDAVAVEIGRIHVGDGRREGTSCGPVATYGQFTRLLALRESALEAGAEPVGKATVSPGATGSEGYFVEPQVFAAVPEDHDLATREIFGPFVGVRPIGRFEEGLEAVNADDHGLVTAIHTSNLATASRFAREARCGIVKINRRTTGNGVSPPFGGWKASSSGAFPEGGRQALDFFTQTKTVYAGF